MIKSKILPLTIVALIGCDQEVGPTRPIPPDRYDGSFFDARRPFDPPSSNPGGPGYGYGSGSGSGTAYGPAMTNVDALASADSPDAGRQPANTASDAGPDTGGNRDDGDDQSGGTSAGSGGAAQ